MKIGILGLLSLLRNLFWRNCSFDYFRPLIMLEIRNDLERLREELGLDLKIIRQGKRDNYWFIVFGGGITELVIDIEALSHSRNRALYVRRIIPSKILRKKVEWRMWEIAQKLGADLTYA